MNAPGERRPTRACSRQPLRGSLCSPLAAAADAQAVGPQDERLEMRLLKKVFAPKEAKAAFRVLEEASFSFTSDAAADLFAREAFRSVRRQVEDVILARPAEFVRAVRQGKSPRECVYFAITHIAGRQLGSGRYHVYRGVLNTLGPGPSLVRLFDTAVDELARIGAVDAEVARTQKAAIRKEIKSVG